VKCTFSLLTDLLLAPLGALHAADTPRLVGLWLGNRPETRQRAAREVGEPVPSVLPPDEPLFRVPAALVKILRRDLNFAGISTKEDAQGRKLDVHCLRVSFSTLLAKVGAAPRVAQAALRHSTINLTMNAYTDESLLPVAEMIEAMPVSLPRLLPAPVPGNLAPAPAMPARPCPPTWRIWFRHGLRFPTPCGQESWGLSRARAWPWRRRTRTTV